MSKIRIKRRTFLKIMGYLPASLYLAACAPKQSPTPEIPITPIVNQPGAVSSIVGVVKADSYDRKLVRRQVQAALDAIGGIGDIVKPGARVAIKVNLTGGTCCTAPHKVPRAESYWTHPEVVRALGELLRDAGARSLYIVEGLFTANSFVEGGYADIAKSIDAVLVDLNSAAPYASFAKTAVGKDWLIYETFEFNPILDNIDTFISVPKLKCHLNCGITVAMKNLIGLGPMPNYCMKPDDTNRTAFHGDAADTKSRLPRVVVDLNRARPIHLALVDGITTTDGGEGPWITPTHMQSPGVLIAGKNAVATDAVAAAVMGFDPTADYPARPFSRGDNHLNIARGLGLGTNRLDEITVKGIASLDEVRQQFASS
jgi:uncharacterized protein (DUF362 family)